MEQEKRAIVTFASDKEYLENFNKTFRPSVERYAQKIEKDLIIVTAYIRPSPRRAFWQRLVMFSHPEVSKYDKVLMIDADIYITKHAKNVFDAVGMYPWGIAKNNAYDLPKYATGDLKYYDDCPTENRPTFAGNGGMYVISRSYKDELEKIYDEYHLKESRGYEVGPLCYFLFNEGKGIILPPEFNTLVLAYMEKYGHSLSSVMRMYDEASFLHFAAGQWHFLFLFLKWFDTTNAITLKKIVRFFAKKKFDSITGPFIAFAQRCVGSYEYRFQKYFTR